MKSATGALFAALFCLVSLPAAALTVYDCVDAHGNHVFMENCPPGMKPASETKVPGRKPQAPPTIDEIAKKTPVTIYTAPHCDACDLVRHYLEQRKVPFTEKNVGNNADLQKELQQKTGGLTVPVTLIGEQKLVGYNRIALKSTLDAAKYPDPAKAAQAQTPAAAGKAHE